MGSVTTLAPVAGNSLLRNVAAHLAGPRNGPLPLLPLLRRVCNAALLYPSANSDWNAGRGDSYQVANPFARGAVRHRDRRTDCRISSSGFGANDFVDVLQAHCRRHATIRHLSRLSDHLRTGTSHTLSFRTHARSGTCS